MTNVLNRPILKPRRRELRRNQTEVEKILWQCLRNKRFKGHKFFRQYSAGPYILDFYCPQLELAIELDGSQHLESDQKIHDEERTRYLKILNIQVLRFWNNDVLRNLDGVLEAICSITESNSSQPPLSKRGGV